MLGQFAQPLQPMVLRDTVARGNVPLGECLEETKYLFCALDSNWRGRDTAPGWLFAA